MDKIATPAAAVGHDSEYRPDIDGLRAIAVLTVVTFHAFPGLMPGGFVGVDVFFVISGYLISRIILRSLREGRFSFVDFYIRRARRIFPALATVLVLCLAFGAVALLADEYAQLGKHAAAGAGFVANLVLWSEVGYFDVAAPTKPLLHLWSLGVEEQFYLAWPFVLWAGWKVRLPIPLLIAGLALASFLTSLASDPAAMFYSPLSRTWQLMAGALIGWWSLNSGAQSDRSGAAQAASAVGLAAIGASAFLLNSQLLYPGWWAVIPTAGAALVLATGASSWSGKLLSWAPLVWIGLISYELYLVHWPALSFARIIVGDTPTHLTRLIVVLCSGVAAWGIYRFVENPLRFGGHGTGKAAWLAVTLAMVAALGLWIYASAGFPQRHGDYESLMAPFEWNDNWGHQDACLANFPQQTQCLETLPGQPHDAVLIGDSHAHHYYAGLSEKLGQAGENLLLLGAGGCVPFLDLQSAGVGYEDACVAAIGEGLEYALAQPSVRTIILASRGPVYLTGVGFGDIDPNNRFIRSLSHPELDGDYKAVFETTMRETLARLVSSGKRVAFVVDVAELGFDPASCVGSRPLFAFFKRDPCAVPRAEFDQRNASYHALIDRVLADFPEVVKLDPNRTLCDDQWCWAEKDGVILYRNDDHLNEAGSRLVAAEMEGL